MFHLTYDGDLDQSHKVFVTERPSVPAPEEDLEEIEIPGMDGVLIERKNRYKPITIPVTFNFYQEPDEWMEIYRDVKKWLAGSGWLIFSDDPDYEYKVLYAKIGTTERTIKRKGRLEVDFVCDPYMYVIAGQEAEEFAGSSLENDYDVSHPIYTITGQGSCTLTVNDGSVTAYAVTQLTIDTDRMIAYNADGEVANADTSGDYEDLYLQEGANTISITDGFGLTIQPNWRCK